jgi:hypothetical protein
MVSGKGTTPMFFLCGHQIHPDGRAESIGMKFAGDQLPGDHASPESYLTPGTHT